MSWLGVWDSLSWVSWGHIRRFGRGMVQGQGAIAEDIEELGLQGDWAGKPSWPGSYGSISIAAAETVWNAGVQNEGGWTWGQRCGSTVCPALPVRAPVSQQSGQISLCCLQLCANLPFSTNLRLMAVLRSLALSYLSADTCSALSIASSNGNL